MPDTPDLIMELNDFANHCGYFFNACMQDGIIANNGYNCSHPDQDETMPVQTTSMNSLASIFRQWTTSSCRTRIPSGDCGRPG